jgi:hypothetical protein
MKKEIPMLQLDIAKTEARPAQRAATLSASLAENISRIWQAVAFIEEVRADLANAKTVQQYTGREASLEAMLMASGHLTVAASVLVPRELAHRARVARLAHNGHSHKKLLKKAARAAKQSAG